MCCHRMSPFGTQFSTEHWSSRLIGQLSIEGLFFEFAGAPVGAKFSSEWFIEGAIARAHLVPSSALSIDPSSETVRSFSCDGHYNGSSPQQQFRWLSL